MKKTAFLINTSRGSVLNLNDLNKIKNKKNLSIFIDVFDSEPYTNKKFLNSKYNLVFLSGIL